MPIAHQDFKKCYKTFRLRGDQELLPQQWFICTLDLLSSSIQGQWPWGMPYHCRDMCTRCLGHWASSIREKQPFVSFQLSRLEKMPAALFWLSILINKLRLLPREAHSPGKFSLTKNIRLKGEGQATSLLKDISTGHCYHYWQIQRPQHQPGSALSPAALLLFIPAEYQAFYIYTRYRSVSEYRFL